MAFGSVRTTVSDTATILATGEKDVALQNLGSTSVDLGGSAVATGAGYRLAPGDSVTLRVSPGNTLYGVVATGTCVIGVLTL